MKQCGDATRRCDAMQCDAIQGDAMRRRDVMQGDATQGDAMRCN